VPQSRFLFTGREYDAVTGLYHYRARAYSTKLERFLQLDPIDFHGAAINLYQYVGNNTINYNDPFGLKINFPQGFDSSAVRAYLSISEAGRALLNYFDCEGGPDVNVEIGNFQSNGHVPGQVPLILWNPNKSFPLGLGNKPNSPAIGLAHELTHAKHITTPGGQYLRDKMDLTVGAKWTNREEYNTIKEVNVIAGKLGETLRGSH